MKDIASDGHCLYRAVADQLLLHSQNSSSGSSRSPHTSAKSQPLDFVQLRKMAAHHMRSQSEEFAPFLGMDSGSLEYDLYCRFVCWVGIWMFLVINGMYIFMSINMKLWSLQLWWQLDVQYSIHLILPTSVNSASQLISLYFPFIALNRKIEDVVGAEWGRQHITHLYPYLHCQITLLPL